MPGSKAGNEGNSSTGQEADDKRVLEHARTVLARLKSLLQERRRKNQSRRVLIISPTVAT